MVNHTTFDIRKVFTGNNPIFSKKIKDPTHPKRNSSYPQPKSVYYEDTITPLARGKQRSENYTV